MMNIRIYQINHERDMNQAMFMNTEYLAHKFDEVKPDSSSYDLVFEGKVDRNTLEGVYQMFNLEHPVGYVGRSLSVSDVVEVVDGAREPPDSTSATVSGSQKSHLNLTRSRRWRTGTRSASYLWNQGKRPGPPTSTERCRGCRGSLEGIFRWCIPLRKKSVLSAMKKAKLPDFPSTGR